VNAVMIGQATPNHMGNVARYIQPAVDRTKEIKNDRLAYAIKANVQDVIKQLQSSPVISQLLQANKLKIVGGYYHLRSGQVEIIQ